MDTHTMIALTVLTDHLKRQQALIQETLDMLGQIHKVPEDPEALDPLCRMNPDTAEPGPAGPENNRTFEQVREIFTDRSSRGMKAEMKAILTAHGLQKLSDAKGNQPLLNILAAEAEATGNG